MSCFEKYLCKLNPECDAFFQRPKQHPATNGNPWYANAPVGKNTLNDMMKTISVQAQLDTIYTNHSVRATVITTLHDNDFPTEQIMTISKHKHVDSVKSYWADTNIVQKNTMATSLSSSMGVTENLVNTENATTPSGSVIQNRNEEMNIPALIEPIELSQTAYDSLLKSKAIVPIESCSGAVVNDKNTCESVINTNIANHNLSLPSSILSSASFNGCTVNFNFK